jgi:hypothetical protein
VIKTTHCLAASPELLQGREIQNFTELHEFPNVVLGIQKSQYYWHLKNHEHDEVIDIPF